MAALSITLRLSAWVDAFLSANRDVYPTIRERMLLAIELSRLNTDHQTGGPFGAAIFEQNGGKLVAVGVNTVLLNRSSIAHAEIIAITLAQQYLGCYDLGAPSLQRYELVTSSEPCALGAFCGQVCDGLSAVPAAKTFVPLALTKGPSRQIGFRPWRLEASP
jgi:hypothetical protein